MKESIVREKSFNFAIRIINLYRYLIKNKKEFVLSKQILRSGTSIGANVEEAQGGCSKKDFISKVSIAYKEAKETNYWISLLKSTDYISKEQAESMSKDCEELLKILGAIQKTSKSITRNS